MQETEENTEQNNTEEINNSQNVAAPLQDVTTPVDTKDDAENIDAAIERNKYVFDLVNHWIDSADSKVTTSYTIFTVLFTVITLISDNISGTNVGTGQAQNLCLINISHIVAGIGYGLFTISAFLHVWAVKPRLYGKKSNNVVNKEYSIFFEDIKKFKNANDYREHAKNVSDEEFNNSLLSEIYYNSKIASRKMMFHGWGQVVSIVSIALLLISLYLKTIA